MTALFVTLVVIGLLLAAPFVGKDSRDGRDWEPLRMPTTLPGTDRPMSPSKPKSAPWLARLVRWREQRRSNAPRRHRPSTNGALPHATMAPREHSFR
jgi:hypothetical protein